MKNKLLAAFIFFVCNCAIAQRGYRLEMGVMTGVSNYLGEIGGREKAARPFLWDMKMAKTRWNESIYVRYKFDPIFAAKLSGNFMRIEGDDKLSSNAGRRYRNLSFRNDIYDVEATLQWLFFNSASPMGVYSRTNIYLTAYLFAGIGGFYHNPKTLYQGSWINLKSARTEGVTYSNFGYVLPMGAGFYVTLNKRKRSHRIGLEINWRYTNTDYLDDISSKEWKSPAELSALGFELANRNDEVTRQPDNFAANYGWHGLNSDGDPVNKAPRGDPNDKDSFISLNVTYGVALKKGRGRFSKSRGRRIRSVTF